MQCNAMQCNAMLEVNYIWTFAIITYSKFRIYNFIFLTKLDYLNQNYKKFTKKEEKNY